MQTLKKKVYFLDFTCLQSAWTDPILPQSKHTSVSEEEEEEEELCGSKKLCFIPSIAPSRLQTFEIMKMTVLKIDWRLCDRFKALTYRVLGSQTGGSFKCFFQRLLAFTVCTIWFPKKAYWCTSMWPKTRFYVWSQTHHSFAFLHSFLHSQKERKN